MGLIRVMERGGDDYREYKKAVKMAKEAIETICELTDDMEEKFSERGGSSMRGGYSRREDWEEEDRRSEMRRHYR